MFLIRSQRRSVITYHRSVSLDYKQNSFPPSFDGIITPFAENRIRKVINSWHGRLIFRSIGHWLFFILYSELWRFPLCQSQQYTDSMLHRNLVYSLVHYRFPWLSGWTSQGQIRRPGVRFFEFLYTMPSQNKWNIFYVIEMFENNLFHLRVAKLRWIRAPQPPLQRALFLSKWLHLFRKQCYLLLTC